MSHTTLRPVELAAAALLSAAVLLVAISPALLAAPPQAAPAVVRGARAPGIESKLPGEWRFA